MTNLSEAYIKQKEQEMCETCPCAFCDRDTTRQDPCLNCADKERHQKKWKYETCDRVCPRTDECDHDCPHCTRYQLDLCEGDDDEEDEDEKIENDVDDDHDEDDA